MFDFSKFSTKSTSFSVEMTMEEGGRFEFDFFSCWNSNFDVFLQQQFFHRFNDPSIHRFQYVDSLSKQTIRISNEIANKKWDRNGHTFFLGSTSSEKIVTANTSLTNGNVWIEAHTCMFVLISNENDIRFTLTDVSLLSQMTNVIWWKDQNVPIWWIELETLQKSQHFLNWQFCHFFSHRLPLLFFTS